MENIVISGIEVGFNDLSEKMQEKLYHSDMEKYAVDVAKSKNPKIRKLLIRDSATSSKILDIVFEEERFCEDISNLKMVWNHPNFKKNVTKIELLAKSNNEKIRKFVANTGEISSKHLNEMLRSEVESNQSEDVIRTILNNSNFNMEDKTRRLLFDTGINNYCIIVAEDQGSSKEFLSEMLENEMLAGQDDYVIYAIISNENFQMEEKFKDFLIKRDFNKIRKKVAENENLDSEFLNEMLRHEVVVHGDITVETTILSNPNFTMDDKTRKLLVNQEYFIYRLRVVDDPGTTVEFLNRMYERESEIMVRNAIENKLIKLCNNHSITLNYMQKKKILDVLKKLRNSKKKIPLTAYLEQIIQILE